MINLVIDPAIQKIILLVMSFLFFTACRHKMQSYHAFKTTLGNYQVFPESWVFLIAPIVVALECLLAASFCLLFLGGDMFAFLSLSYSALLAISLLGVYAIAIAINVWRGRTEIDCGCTGSAAQHQAAGQQGINYFLVVRNMILITLLLITLLPVASRSLVWLDYFLIAASTVIGIAIYNASNLANSYNLTVRSFNKVNS